MKLGKYRFIPKGRYFCPNDDIKTAEDVRRERNVALWTLIAVFALAIGIPLLANLGKSIFGIEPIIY